MLQGEFQPKHDNKNPEGSKVTLQSERLPILNYSTEIREKLLANDITIVVGETGSGKTTEIPLMLQEALGGKAKIAVTQPRRVAARSVASYVAGKIQTEVGKDIGYHVRFDDRTTEGTRITFMTDGILLRKIQEDPTLSEYAAIMVDEAHERSLNIDLTLGLLKRLQRERAETGLPPVKILVSSATLEKEKFAKYFKNAPVVEVEGRQFPVEVHYQDRTYYDYIGAAAGKVKQIVEERKEGDILIFLPGQEEIESTIEQIERFGLADTVILPLYGAMSPEDQDRIFRDQGKRKVVVSTNVSETSVTVPGIKHVVDSGFIKQMEFNPETGIQSLVTTPHAKSGCIQRTGRAGRISAGECHRLYDKDDFEDRPEFQAPEIQRSNLANVVLTMKRMGIEDVGSFEFIDPPEPEAIKLAIETLKTLGALDENENITNTGEVMADLPLEPHIGRMIIEAERRQCVETVCTLAAFMSTRSVFVRPKGEALFADQAHMQFRLPESDFLTLWKVWKAYEANNFNRQWARDNFLHSRVLEEVRDIRFQLFRALKRNGIRVTENNDPDAIGKSVASGLIGNLMEYEGFYSYKRIKDDEGDFYIHPSSSTFGTNPRFFVPGEIVKTTKTYARVIQTIKPEWIKEIAPQLVKEEVSKVYYDSVSDTVKKKVVLTLKGSNRELQVEEREASGKEAAEAFATFLAQFMFYPVEGESQYPFIGHNREIIKQLNDLWNKSEGSFMEARYTTEQLKSWYTQHLGDIHSLKSLEEEIKDGGVNLELDINEFLSAEERDKILRDNPDTIEINGKEYEIMYGFDDWIREFKCSCDLEAQDILQLEELPKLLSGRSVEIRKILVNGVGMVISVEVDLERLKKMARGLLTLEEDRVLRAKKQRELLDAVSSWERNYRRQLLTRQWGLEEPKSERRETSHLKGLSLRREQTKLRIDNYWELAGQSVEELGKIINEEKGKDIGRWRLAVAALLSKGQVGAEVLIAAEVGDTETLDAVEKTMQKAVSEAKTYSRVDFRKVISSVDDSKKSVELYKRLVVADKHKLVKDFLGEDKEARQKFRRLFYELIQGRYVLPDVNSLGPDINQALENMTS